MFDRSRIRFICYTAPRGGFDDEVREKEIGNEKRCSSR